jgi:hypothetical protein
MRNNLLKTVALALCLFAYLGCAEREPVSDIEAHPAAWMAKGDVDFHGQIVEDDGIGFCGGCHGEDLQGFGGAPSCYSCHDGAGGHPSGWGDRPEPGHVGEVALQGNGGCTSCHGGDFTGGWSEISCYDCHAGGPSGHPDGWMDERSSSFHGIDATLNSSLRCTDCHGRDLLGGTSGVACAQCH